MSKPTRRITSPEDLTKWIESDTYNLLLNFIQSLQDLILGKTNDDSEVIISTTTTNLLNILNEVDATIDKHPVVIDKDISRFGKVEFRDFYDHLSQSSQTLLSRLTSNPDDLIELGTYFQESWGNRTRIDYGSGHELNFITFLLCLSQLNIITLEDYPAIILHVFTKYMTIMRRLQKLYWLEPAGSHGVWGLDDYHFLPFLFGAAQLANHPYMKPKLIHNEELVEMYKDKYMYMECIHFINTIKTLPQNQEQKLSLRWHSPMLDDILAAKSWLKIKEGMIKMYKVEVLGKLPIIQHFMFGRLIPCPPGIAEHTEEEDDGDHQEDECGHVHTTGVLNTWGDCCGIKIPSAIAASESLRLQEAKKKHKPIPFD